jgi:hypothetical protein
LGCFYISAYARWQGDTTEISRLRGELRAAQAETQRLEAEVSRFETPQYVRARASELKLCRRTRIL